MKARRIIGNILIIISVAFTIYLSVIMIHRIGSVVEKADYTKVFCYELVVCAIFILLALDIRFVFTRVKAKALKVFAWILRIIVVLMTAIFLFFIGRIIIGCFINTEDSAKNAIVLGLALENGKPTDDLISKLDCAEKYLQDYPDATLILSGGNSDSSGKTEAGVMRDILSERGIADEKMVEEDSSTSTKENFKNVAKLIDTKEAVVLISSDYHMDRAVRAAKNAGFSEILRLPAPSSAVQFGANVMWEMMLELNELFTQSISPEPA